MRNYIDIIKSGRIDELNGYRNSPEVDDFKNATAQWSKYKHSNRSLMDTFLQKMKEKGYKPLGNGCYGAVVGHDALDYVVKVFYADQKYLKFLRYALANQDNPHLPKFRGKIMSIDGKYYAIRMEKLDKMTPTEALAARQLDVFGKSKWSMREFLMHNEKNIERGYMFARATKKILEGQPKLLSTIEVLRRMDQDAIDLHENNFMRRADGTIVVIDPFFEEPTQAVSAS